MFEKNEIKTLTTQIKSNLKNKYLLCEINLTCGTHIEQELLTFKPVHT